MQRVAKGAPCTSAIERNSPWSQPVGQALATELPIPVPGPGVRENPAGQGVRGWPTLSQMQCIIGGMLAPDFSTLFDFLPIGAYRSSPSGKQLRANAAPVRLNGYGCESEMLAAVDDIGSEWYVDPFQRAEFTRLLECDGHVVDFGSEICRHNDRGRSLDPLYLGRHAQTACRWSSALAPRFHGSN